MNILVIQQVFCFLSVSSPPQCAPMAAVKDRLYSQLRAMPAISPASVSLIPYGDCNGHRGRTGSGYKKAHGDYGYEKSVPDIEGERILEYALAYGLLLSSSLVIILII